MAEPKVRPKLVVGQRVYVHGEEAFGAVASADEYSVYVRLDSDDTEVSAAWEQIELIDSVS